MDRINLKDEWMTPPYIWKAAQVALGGKIDLDPAAEWRQHLPQNIPTRIHFFRDGLDETWFGRVFLNPPHSRAARPGLWVDKAIHEYEVGNTSGTIMLLPARLETEWFRPCHKFPMVVLHKRVSYVPVFPDRQKDYGSGMFPSVIVALGITTLRLHRAFSHLGTVYIPYAAEGGKR